MTEAGTRKRASLHLLRGEAALAEHDPGGLEPLERYARRLRRAPARRATTPSSARSPTRTSSRGIGNAYSDEILHAARLSPFKQTQKLTDDEMDRLFVATRDDARSTWRERLRAETGDGFPDQRHRVPAGDGRARPLPRSRVPVCGAPVQRIAYADNEANYCARCQTDGKLLADRALSRLLHDDWPKTLEELEARRPAAATAPSKKPGRRRR